MGGDHAVLKPITIEPLLISVISISSFGTSHLVSHFSNRQLYQRVSCSFVDLNLNNFITSPLFNLNSSMIGSSPFLPKDLSW